MIFTVTIKALFGGYNGFKQFFSDKSRSSMSKLLAKILLKGYELESNCFLPIHFEHRGPINFMHGSSGIYISGKAKIGRNLTIFQNVTVGSNLLGVSKNFGAP